jgi:hypothetical protein
MQILFKTRDPQARELAELAVQRLRFALRRHRPRVPQATVALSDVNGPRGGVDKRCRVELGTDGAGRLVVSAVAGDWRSALDRALARATRLLSQLGPRGRRLRRGRSFALDLPG